MRGVARRGFRLERGGMYIELAIILPIFIAFLAGIIQYGFLFNSNITLRSAAAIAARYAALTSPTPTVDQVKQMAQGALAPLDPTKLADPVVNMNETVGPVTDAKRVDLTYNHPLFFPFVVPGSVGGVFQLNATAVMR